jgi:hypothetical protein
MTKGSFRQRYDQVERIGAGGMGEVFKGHDARSGRWVAIKLLHAAIAADKTSLLRFEREIKTQAEMDHTNIAQLFGVEDFKEGPCMIMQYVDGVPLSALIVPGKALQASLAYSILNGILAGMAHAHGAGIIHRDLKPSNILISKRGIPKIIDFGIAKQQSERDVTRMGSAPGTVSYMAPELHTASQPASTRSDVFSLGIICYELLTGTHPFRRDTEFATTQAILSESPAPMQELAPGLPDALSSTVLRALAKEPARRQKSAEELLEEMGRCGMAGASEGDVRSAVAAVMPAGGSPSDTSASGSAVRAPGMGRLSRPVFGLLQLNWMIYAAVITLLTAGAVAWLVVSMRKPAPAPSRVVNANASPAVAAPQIPDTAPIAGGDGSATSAAESPGSLTMQPGIQSPPQVAAGSLNTSHADTPAALSPAVAVRKTTDPAKGTRSFHAAVRATQPDAAAGQEDKRKKALDALSGKAPEDK